MATNPGAKCVDGIAITPFRNSTYKQMFAVTSALEFAVRLKSA
jgi:hypothetical protein